jgi:serine/threonine protein kinase/formylglycine-generating enzyme required for sulfatase activity
MNDPNPTGPCQSAATAAVTAVLPKRIGRYRVERVLGTGGFGMVYLAHDERLQRLVAIKVPHRHLVTRPEDAAVYLIEARTVAGLDHPNIVPVYDSDSTDEFPVFIVSKFIEGSTLAERIKTNRPSVAEAVQLVATVAETLHYAHRKGLVHRDIKPGNILLDVSGKPYVADFGLALKEENVGQGPRYAGTPAYMSPEQARGEGHRVDGRSDIFSLGIVLYRLLTGQRPFHSDFTEELLEQIANREVRPLRQWDDSIPKELDRICMQALSKRASERYTTAMDMGDDLRHFLAEASAAEKSKVSYRDKHEDDVVTPTPRLVLTPTESQLISIVPKGLRSFDTTDADFFLQLLPGPRDRDGLPDSIRFWKSRIETTNADNTFSVGLIYGPSGCGKSSLVKAGLLPRLRTAVTVMYVEATADETEARLLKGLRHQVPDLPADIGLTESLTALRQGRFLEAGRKVLLVLDQFEQWLHAKRREDNTELVQALRQCHGDRVQCLVLVRDDFWLAVSRFMQALEIRVLEGENSRLVDLFDLLHARKVLAGFGRAYGRLPHNPGQCRKEQEVFLDQAVAGLAQDGKVIPVRLALFAEMVKGKLWTPATLREVGGIEGIGVTFLEETFTASTAPPEHRLHQNAVHAVLSALLPGAGTEIKGCMRSRSELLDVSGYRQAPAAFDALLRILDSETRLLTPIAKHSNFDSPASVAAPASAGEPCYQLTHDYLVPSIREWLVRKQKETRRGRAELRLAERGAMWRAKPEQRQLPSLMEWLSIRLLTAPRNWTDTQRQMMRAAARKHLTEVARFGAVVVLLACAVVFLRKQLAQETAATRANDMVRLLLYSDIAKTPAIIDDIAEFRQLTDPQLEKVLADPTAPSERQLRARLALLPVDPRQVEYLRENMLDADPISFLVLREALMPYRAELVDGFWDILAARRGDPQRQFRAAAALAAYDPTGGRWKDVESWVAKQLVVQPTLLLPHWVEALRPIKDRLVPSLMAILRDRTTQPTTFAVVAEVVGDYASQDPGILVDAIAHAGPNSFPTLLSRLQVHSNQAVTLLTQMLDRISAEGGTAPNDAASQRANLAIALLRLNQGQRLWPLLKMSPNPRVRSFIIDRFASLGCDPAVLLARLETEPDDTIRAALWLGLGDINEASFPAARRVAVAPQLLDVYRHDPSAAVHAAAYWLMGKWGLRDVRPPASEPSANSDSHNGKQWYVNSLGQTMVRFTGPITYMMGALPDEPGRQDLEKGHEAHIDYSYDIGMTEVTVAQFRRFLQQRGGPNDGSHYAMRADLAPDMPVTRVSWYDAAAFCNWQSRLDDIPRNQWCYEPNEGGDFAERMTIAPQATRKIGYRLPTEAEWEYACRGGATTMRCYGDAEELLTKYAWFGANAGDDSSPVTKLLPNAYGLFDMHGNASEWCQDRYPPFDDRQHAEIIISSDFRAVRGGNIRHYAKVIRSAKRFADRPTLSDAGGFRIARSRP